MSSDDEDEPELGGERRARPRWALTDRLTADELQAVVDGYLAGATIRELAKRFSISESSIKRVLRKANVGRRRKPPG